MSPTTTPEPWRRRLIVFLAIALAFGAAHHGEHIVRDVVGWPFADEITPFTFSLAIYPAVLLGLYLFSRRLVGSGFWTILTGAGALVVGFIHATPFGDEHPRDVFEAYDSAVAGGLAVAIAFALVAALVAASVYAGVQWARRVSA